MEYRSLGRTGLVASALGFGCSRIAQARDRDEAVATLESALDRGINLFDTANAYDEDERLLGRVLRGRRDRVILCSKAGYRSRVLLAIERWVTLPGVLRRRAPSPAGTVSRPVEGPSRWNFAPRWIRLGIEGSLGRLGTDCLDVFYLHSPPPEVVADDSVFETLDRLRQEGRLRHYGISFAGSATTDHILSALRHPGISIVQVLANPLESVNLERIAPAAARLGTAMVGRQPFHRGAVFHSSLPAEALSVRTERTPAQTVLRSALQRGIDVVLVGMRSRSHLDENLGALDVPPLGADEMQRLYAGTRIT